MKKTALLTTLLLSGSALSGLALAASPADTLVIQSASDVPTTEPAETYDGASAELVGNMYETLLAYDGASLTKFRPMLATKWALSNGGQTYTFDLRKNVKFHNGDPMTCADAEYTFRRNLVTNDTGNSGNWFISDPLLGSVDNANDDKSITWAKIAGAVKCNAAGQLVFNLVKVDPAFLSKLAYAGQSIVDKKYTAGLGDWDGTEATWKQWVGKDLTASPLAKKPNGTGAYQMLKSDANTYLFTAFPGYWGKQPSIKNVIVQKVPELAARQQALLRGDADIIEGADRAVDEAQMKGKPGVTWVDDLPYVNAPALFMNENIKKKSLLGSGKLDGKGVPANFFADANIRRAFAYAFNYGQYMKDVQGGKAKQRTMLIPDTMLGYDAKVGKYTYDPKKAAAYFKQAFGGQVWNNGFSLTVNYRAGSEGPKTAMEMLKKNVEALNPKFHMTIQPEPWSDMLGATKRGEEAMFIIAWIPDYADPDNYLYAFYSSNGFYNGRVNFKDALLDKWLDQARATVNPAERARLYSLVGNRAYEQARYIVMPVPVDYTFYSSRLGNGITKANYNPFGNRTWAEFTKK
ncbi:ABC transporter substrate-binding protein [Deinococcus sp.]|uniref:ABC transporter substrate-binding protein n=1 Tax=Deinococcus sp. TaxID=47478 RepID=UPI0025BD626B|nr:ABC transporter substrate-binding protein [Deinococcus sp.]